jgi:flagellar basal body-associated protein FliL
MRRKRIILILIAVVMAAALLVVYYFYLGSTVPHGQQPLVHLNSSNIGTLKNAFNESSDSVRVIVMLSPT